MVDSECGGALLLIRRLVVATVVLVAAMQPRVQTASGAPTMECYDLLGPDGWAAHPLAAPAAEEATSVPCHKTERFQLRYARNGSHRGDVAMALSHNIWHEWRLACGGEAPVGGGVHNATHVGASTIAVVAPYGILMRALQHAGGAATFTTLCQVRGTHLRAPLVLSMDAVGHDMPMPPRSCLAVSILPSTSAVAAMRSTIQSLVDGLAHDDPSVFDVVVDTSSILVCCAPTASSSPCAFPGTALDAIVEAPTVLHVALMDAPVLHLNYSRGLLASGVSHVEPFADALGLKGSGYVVGITDTGIDTDHCFFRDDAVGVPYDAFNGNHRKIVRYQSYATDSNARGDSVPGHGTHVAATVAGSLAANRNGPATNPFHGVVPNAKISFVDLSGSLAEGIQTKSLESLATIVSNDGATVMTNSWGGGLALYNAACASIDRFVHEIKRSLVVLFSAGNEADAVCKKSPLLPLCDRFTVMAASTSKNVLSVGASQSTQASWEHADLGNYLLVVDNTTVTGALRGFAIKGVAGPPFPPALRGRVVLADPWDLCAPVRGDVQGTILVAHRGTCTFFDKTQAAIDAGAAALVVVNSIPGHGIVMGCPDAACSTVSINAFMVSQDFGGVLASVLPRSSDGRDVGAAWVGTIGATSLPMEDRNPQTLSSFSSHGPTADLRYKPDLVAVGEMLHSARSDGNLHSNNCDLWASQGTSMSCPLVAGLAVMVQEYLARIYTPHMLAPSSALVRAILIQAAKPLAGRYERNFQGDWRPLGDTPNFEEGHGFPMLNSTLPLKPPGATSLPDDEADIEVVLKDEVALLPGAVHRYCIDFRISDKQPTFEATLVWIDPPGSSSVGHQQLINNLDLRVTYRWNGTATETETTHAPGTLLRFGNAKRDVAFEDVAGSSPDVVNNVEKVRITMDGHVGAHRQFVVEVGGTHIATETQPYALVVSGAEVACTTPNACPTSHALGTASEGAVAAACGGRGSCAAGVCHCDLGWAGAACATPVATLALQEVVHVLVLPMAWGMLRIDTPPAPTSQPFQVRVAHSNPMADVDIAICKAALPTLAVLTDPAAAAASSCVAINHERDNANELPAAGSSVAYRVERTLSFNAAPGTTYVVGIHGMCCYPANVSVAVVLGATNASSIRSDAATVDGQRRTISIAATVGKHSLLAFEDAGTPAAQGHVVAQIRHKQTFHLLASGPCARTQQQGAGMACNVSTLATTGGDAEVDDGMLLFTRTEVSGGSHVVTIPHPSLYRLRRTQDASTHPPAEDASCTEGGCASVASSDGSSSSGPAAHPYSHFFRFSGRIANCVPNTTAAAPHALHRQHCHTHTTAVLPNTATGDTFYSEDPPLLPSLVLALDAADVAETPRSPMWVDLSVLNIRAKAVDAHGQARTGIDAWSLTLDCTALVDAYVVVCHNVSGLQAGAMYRVDVVPALGYDATVVPAILRFHPNLTLWVSHYPTISSLSLERFTRYANPLHIAFPTLNAANATLFLQGNFLLPEVPSSTEGDDDSIEDQEQFSQLDAVSVSFSSVTGMFDDIVCDASSIVTSSTIRCLLSAFPVVPEGTLFLVQVRSTRWYAMVRGYVQLVLDPRPRIVGIVDPTLSAPTAAGSIRMDGSLTLVGTAFPVVAVGGTVDASQLGTVTLVPMSGDGAASIRMVTHAQNASCIVVSVPADVYLDASGPFAGASGAASGGHTTTFNVTSTFDVDVPLRIAIGTKADGGGFVAVDGVALATQAMVAAPNAVALPSEALVCNPAPASYLWLSGRRLQLGGGAFRVFLASSDSGPSMKFNCVLKPWLSDTTSNGSGTGHLICRLSPYLQWNRTYHVEVLLGSQSVASIPNRLSVKLAGTNAPMAVAEVATMNLEGVPMQLGATTYFTMAAAGLNSSMVFVDASTSDCDAPVPLEGMELTCLGRSASEDHHDVVLTTFAATPRLLPTSNGDGTANSVLPCFSNGTFVPGLTTSTYADPGDAFYVPLDPMLWQIPSIVSVISATLNQTRDGGFDGSGTGQTVVTHVPIQDSWATGAVDLLAPLTLTIAIAPFVWTQTATLDEDAQPFYVYLGAEVASHDGTTAAAASVAWRTCNASHVVVFGQPDDISSDHRIFTFEGISILRDVLRYRGGSDQQPTAVRLCLEFSTHEATAELMPKTHFAQVLVLHHETPAAPTATITTAPTATPAAATPTTTQPTEPPCPCHPEGGTCVHGSCVCGAAFRGATCALLCPAAPLNQPVICSGRGQCLLAQSQRTAECHCDEGYDGLACQNVAHDVAKPLPLPVQRIAAAPIEWTALSLRSDGRRVPLLIDGAALARSGSPPSSWGVALRSATPCTGGARAAASVVLYNASTDVVMAAVHGVFRIDGDGINKTAVVGPLGGPRASKQPPSDNDAVEVLAAMECPTSPAATVSATVVQCVVYVAAIAFGPQDPPVQQTLPPEVRHRTVVGGGPHEHCVSTSCYVVYSTVGTLMTLCTVLAVVLSVRYRFRVALIEWR